MSEGHIDTKKVDSYSMLIVSKYFNSVEDYINLICVNSKFQETTEKLRYNPISITSLKLFPKIQTQHLYSKIDIKLKGIDNYEIWYEVDYDEYLDNISNNDKYHYVKYTRKNRKQYGSNIENCITILDEQCFSYVIIEKIQIPKTIISIKDYCFSFCKKLQHIKLPNTLLKLPNSCFARCASLKSINIPLPIQSIGSHCFDYCSSLESVTLPTSITSIGEYCFNFCSSLKSIIIPPSIKKLAVGLFWSCSSLTQVIIPTTITTIESYCFCWCETIQTITLPSSLKEIKNNCFSHCHKLTTVNGLSQVRIGHDCFENCDKLQVKY